VSAQERLSTKFAVALVSDVVASLEWRGNLHENGDHGYVEG
jgi:hypothetical protein